MRIPNELINKIMLECTRDDILSWSSFEYMDSITFSKKKDDDIINACKSGNLHAVKYLASTGVDIRYNWDMALRMSSRYGNLDVVKYLVSLGADVRAKNNHALRCSAENGHLEVVKYLVSVGADIRAGNDYALRWSARWGHLEIVKYMVSLGADIHAEDDYAIINSSGLTKEYLLTCTSIT